MAKRMPLSTQTSQRKGDRYVIGLACAFAILWLLLAIGPRYRADWAIENVLTVLCVAVLVVSYRRLPLSRPSYTCLVLFLCLHSLGAHYTYSEVPYDAWFRALTGRGLGELLGWRRNHFDRMVHFLYGVLLVYPVREIVVRATGLRGFWSYFLPLDLTMSSSATYELIEWGAAVVFGGNLGVAYVGSQGDPWDAQKDMGLAALGALLSTLMIAALHRWRARNSRRDRLPHSVARGVESAMPQGFLFGGYFVFWSAMAIAPLDRQNWVLSSILPLALVAALVLGRRALPLSTASYALMIGFLALHTIGAHYTYSRVPMGLWLQHALQLQRNHFDRITHLAFGLLFTYPLFEAFRLLLKDASRPLAYYVTLMTQLGLAAVWEMTRPPLPSSRIPSSARRLSARKATSGTPSTTCWPRRAVPSLRCC